MSQDSCFLIRQPQKAALTAGKQLLNDIGQMGVDEEAGGTHTNILGLGQEVMFCTTSAPFPCFQKSPLTSFIELSKVSKIQKFPFCQTFCSIHMRARGTATQCAVLTLLICVAKNGGFCGIPSIRCCKECGVEIAPTLEIPRTLLFFGVLGHVNILIILHPPWNPCRHGIVQPKFL